MRDDAKLAQGEVFALGIAPRIFTILARIIDTIIKKDLGDSNASDI
ncbi:hypothetical protein LC605_24880 [Nostoc sp. CHAB 5836]|nr:hypothetical protein [Nostoc sp. CHAB 5836]